MADPKFFHKKGPFTAAVLEKVTQSELYPPEKGPYVFEDTGPLDSVSETGLSFLDNIKYMDQLSATKAGGVFVHPKFADRVPEGVLRFVSTTPYRSFALAVQHFYPDPEVVGFIHPRAVVSESATIGHDVHIEAGAVVGANVTVGDGCWIGANAVLEDGVTIGPHARIGACVVLAYCQVGAHCQIHPGTTIGTRGFGFAMDAKGYIDLPQLGRVIIGDHVEIGSNCTVDRGMSGDTQIGDGCKIDNLVHIAHNVVMGKNCVLCGQTGVAGSAVLEDFVVAAGQAGVGPHMRVGKGAQIAGKSATWRDIPAGQKVGGNPAIPIREWHRQNATLTRLSKFKEKPSSKDTSSSTDNSE